VNRDVTLSTNFWPQNDDECSFYAGSPTGGGKYADRIPERAEEIGGARYLFGLIEGVARSAGG